MQNDYCTKSRDGAHVFNTEGVCGYCSVRGEISYLNDAELQDAIDEAKRSQADDMVNAPPHYNQAGIECIDAIAAATSGKSGIEAVCVANVVKYLWRYELKNGVEDVKKARWYLDRLIGELEK